LLSVATRTRLLAGTVLRITPLPTPATLTMRVRRSVTSTGTSRVLLTSMALPLPARLMSSRTEPGLSVAFACLLEAKLGASGASPISSRRG